MPASRSAKWRCSPTRPRTSTIKAETDCEVLRLERSSFLDLVREQPSVALAVAATLSRRLAGMLSHDSTSATAAASVPAGDESVAMASAAARRRWRPGRGALALAAAVGILAFGAALPPPLGLSAVGWHALIILLAALPALALDAVLEGVLALLIVSAWVLFSVVPAADALAGFASPSWVLVVAVLIIAPPSARPAFSTGSRLIAITHMRGGFPGEVAALSLAGLLMVRQCRIPPAESSSSRRCCRNWSRRWATARAPSRPRTRHGGSDRLWPDGRDVSHQLNYSSHRAGGLAGRSAEGSELGHLGALWRARQCHSFCRPAGVGALALSARSRRPAAHKRAGRIARPATGVARPDVAR